MAKPTNRGDQSKGVCDDPPGVEAAVAEQLRTGQIRAQPLKQLGGRSDKSDSDSAQCQSRRQHNDKR